MGVACCTPHTLTKKADTCIITPWQSSCHLKMLIPEREVGNVIGKGGTILRSICEQSTSRVHISGKSHNAPFSPYVTPHFSY